MQAHFGNVARVHADRHRLQVQQNVDDILLDAFDRGVLVQHALDLDLGDRRPRQGGQQHPAQRIAERVAEPRSNGSITMRAWRGDTGCTLTTRGFKNSLIDPCMDFTYVDLTGDDAAGPRRIKKPIATWNTTRRPGSR